jgi:hypothetical protein
VSESNGATPRVFDINGMQEILAWMDTDEIEAIEEKLGGPIDEVLGAGRKRGRVLRAISWIVMRREDPEFTWEQAGKVRWKLQQDAQAVAEARRGVPPTGAAG